MHKTVALALLLLFAITPAAAQQSAPSYAALEADAERLYAEGSYQLAHDAYERAAPLAAAAGKGRWVEFRLADTLWRAQAATETPDSSKFDEAQKRLDALVRDVARVEDRDRVWAEVQESLGDFYWARRDSRNWGAGWEHYALALDWWAGTSDVARARGRYVRIVWKAAEPPGRQEYEYYGYWGNTLPLDTLENVLTVSADANDRARAHYLLAMTLQRSGGDYNQLARIPAEFDAALAPGKAVAWYDDALYHYAQYLENTGRAVESDEGVWSQAPDYVAALAAYRKLTTEFRKGETRYYDDAVQRIENITKTTVEVGVSNVFLPGSEIQFALSWRNAPRVDFALYKVDLTSDVSWPSGEQSNLNVNAWVKNVSLAGRQPVRAWSKTTGDAGLHRPGSEQVRVEGALPVGAYVLEAKAGSATSREAILVTDAALVLKTAPRQALLYYANATTGAPIANARVSIWEIYYANGAYAARRLEGATDADGLARFSIEQHAETSRGYFAAAALGDRQAFAIGSGNSYDADSRGWRLYVTTDRPAYRPGEEAQWKLLARTYTDSLYATPANRVLEYEITDPRGSKVAEGKITLNGFGSAWGKLALTDAMPLGEYRVSYWDEGRQNAIGDATLLRLEEYKLPEFKVDVKTPEENGKKRTFKLGDRVEVTIQADYYFGGPVSDATVEAVVYQKPFFRWWRFPRDYEWFYEDEEISARRYGYYGEGSIVKRETIKTDAEGRATLSFDTPRYQGQEFEYRVEARVVDASRREITSSGTVRVTQHRYAVFMEPDHYLYKPGDAVEVSIKALDANDQPVQTDGAVKIVRDTWREVWRDASGKEVSGPALQQIRDKVPGFPYVSGRQGWTLVRAEYEHEDVSTEAVKTDEKGDATVRFTPAREGFYRVAWSSRDKGSAPIVAETTIWAVTSATTELQYRPGGLQIVVDKDTARVGQTIPVLLTAPASGRTVLFGVEGDDLYDYRVVRMEGSAKLVEVPIDERYVPNVWLTGAMVADQQIFEDSKELVVPPVKNFLTVDVKPDREQYEPRDAGTLRVTTRDADGKPVAAEVGLGLVDESVYAIQSDYAEDPRKFYFGSKRDDEVETTSTFNQKSYVKLVANAAKMLVDARQLPVNGRDEDGSLTVAGGAGANALRGYASLDSPAPPPAPVSEMAADKVTAQAGARAPAKSARYDAFAKKDAKEKQEREIDDVAEFGIQPSQEPAVQVRSDFRSTIFWQPDVVTDANGEAIVKVTYPDSPTTWRATARAATTGAQFGAATASARTKQPLIVRLQAPRFFLVGDTVTISAVVNNNTDAPLSVAPELVAEGLDVEGAGTDGKVAPRAVTVAPGGEARVDWRVVVRAAGTAKLRVTGRGGRFADAMERTYPVYEHGVERLVARSGKTRGDDTTVTLDVPAARKKDSTKLAVQLTPSMAVTALDALPYLVDYPYGCTEQTMSRFLPAAITAKTLVDLGLKPEDVEGRIFGGVEPATADATHPKGKRPVGALAEVTKQSLERLYDFQHADGGWGWWKEGDSDHYMTAYVVWGMSLARMANVQVKADALERGVAYLDKEIVEEENAPDMQAWMLYALSTFHASVKGAAQLRAPSEFARTAFDNLWSKRDALNAYTRALLALAAHNYDETDRAQTLVRNLVDGVKVDRTPDTSVVVKSAQRSGENVVATAHWGADRISWRWSDGPVEGTSFALRALLAIDPKNPLVEPVTNWLVKNRRGAQWSNTRDTAIAVLALDDYLRASGELASDVDYELLVNGRSIAARHVGPADVIAAPSRFEVPASDVRDGANEIRIVRRGGAGALYFAAEATFYSLEEPVPPAGNEIFVRRDYYKLVGRATLLKGYVYDRVPLRDGESVKSGERVETVITIEAKNDYEYLLFEDLKPAGFEATEVRSGESLYARQLKANAVKADRTGDATDYADGRRWVYRELRDRKVAMFVDKLPEGVWEIRYDMRAEVPGSFHALPVMGHAMYVPEIRCNGAEARVTVTD